jgi:hypothetical protein
MIVPTATETTSYLTLAKIRDYFVWPASSGPHLLRLARIFGDKFASPITFVSLRGWISQREYANTAFPLFRKKTCAQLPAET